MVHVSALRRFPAAIHIDRKDEDIMKLRVLGYIAVSAICLSITSSVSVAQVADSTVWGLFAANGAQPVASANLVADSNIVGPAAGWVIASYNSNGQRCNLGAAGWPAAEPDTAAGRYVQFTTAAKAGKSLTVTNISFNYGGAGSTNAVRAKAFYSVDNWKTATPFTPDTALLYPNSTVAPYSKAVNVAVPANQKFMIRVYPYWVGAAAGSSSKYSVLNTMVVTGTTKASTGVAATSAMLPERFALAQNYPNPFNPSTHIDYSLRTKGFTTLKVYDVIGNEAATLVSEVKDAGIYTATFNAAALPSGLYISVLSSGGQTVARKMVLMK